METYRRQAALLKAIGHPVRLQIVDLLRIEPECVCHLSAALDKPQPYVSQQLAILRNAGVIVDERDGTNIFYRLADDNVARQVAAACADARSGAIAGSAQALAVLQLPEVLGRARAGRRSVQGGVLTGAELAPSRRSREDTSSILIHLILGGIPYDPAHQDPRRRLRQLRPAGRRTPSRQSRSSAWRRRSRRAATTRSTALQPARHARPGRQ